MEPDIDLTGPCDTAPPSPARRSLLALLGAGAFAGSLASLPLDLDAKKKRKKKKEEEKGQEERWQGRQAPLQRQRSGQRLGH